jgi:hypothetical protein
MWDLRRNRKECAIFLDALEAAWEKRPDVFAREELLAELPANLREHGKCCKGCARNIDNLLTTRNALRGYATPASFNAPWFAARVMARISTEERVRASEEATWSVLPRLASRFAGVAVLALVLAAGWLIKGPLGNPASASTVESFDGSQAQVSYDDPLGGVQEKAQ